MGVVYAAYDPQLERKIAIKVLRGGSARAEERHRLLREAQAMARLSHANVVAVHDVGTVAGAVFVAMEFVEGATLGDWQRAQDRSWRELVEMYVQAARGLHAAHVAGLVHRDFKPDNVLVSRSGQAKVTDFGLVRATGGGESPEDARATGVEAPAEPSSSSSSLEHSITRAGALLGTPAYMAPE
ncbi:MAG: serine/threonine protein kinase, partial [Myxococcales bacterium]|nr:serine/threonine protein kinase [Myxococcales bacterium]